MTDEATGIVTPSTWQPAIGVRWKPSPLVLASFALHAVGLGLLIGWPALWPWVVGTLALNHVLLTACGLVPRSDWLGTNWRRLPAAAIARNEIALTFDDGPDPQVTPAVLDLLDSHGARATFFCIGTTAQQHAALCREIVRRGHAVENHSQHHRHNFSFLFPRAFAREIGQAQQSLTLLTGETPRFFRAPAGLRNPFLDAVLQRMGLTLVSWTRRAYDTRVADVERIVHTLAQPLAAGDIVLLHDGHASRTPDGAPAILGALPRILEQAKARGLHPVTLRQAST